MPQPPSYPLCMDARMLRAEGGTGVASYARQLHRALTLLGEEPLLLSDRRDLDRPFKARLARPRRWLRALWPFRRRARRRGQLLVARDIFRVAQVHFDIYGSLLPVKVKGPPGIMHWSCPVPIRLIGWHNLYTVHDAIPLIRPSLSPIDSFRHRWLLARIAEAASAILTVSEAARDEIVEATGCRASLVIDCGAAVDAEPAPAEALPPQVERGRYLLVCGTIEWRKNIGAILRAYQDSGVDLPLVLAGPDGMGADEIGPAIAATPGAIRLPYLPADAMRALIGHARALLMPSLMEGFGLPVAEAMALGVPVVTSNQGALAETAGGAALAVDPRDVGGIADAIRRVVHDEALRAELIQAGRRNAERFTVDRFAARLAELHDHVIAQVD